MKQPKKTAVDEAIERAIKISSKARSDSIIDGYEDMLKKSLEDPELEKKASMEQMMRDRMSDIPIESIVCSDVYDIRDMFPAAPKKVLSAEIPTEENMKEYEAEANRVTPMWKFGELEALHALEQYIGATYEQHYSDSDGIQAFDAILSAGHGVGFCVGDIIKYAMRLGKKDGWNRKDVMKILHYGILLLHAMDKEKK